MKRTFLIIIIFVFMLSGCSTDYIENIDSFIIKFNEYAKEKIDKNSMILSENKESISYYYMFENESVIEIENELKNMHIKSVSLTAEKYSENFKNRAQAVLKSLSEYDFENAEALTDNLFSDTKKEYANEMHTLKYITINYTKTSVGLKFTVTYNEEVPVITTVTPETMKEFS